MITSLIGAGAEQRASLAGASAEEIRRQIAGLRPDLNEATLTFRAAVLLLLGPQLRFNIDRLSSRTRYPRGQVAACTRRLFDHGVWRPEGPDYHWSSPADPRFWSDVAVAEGQLCRRIDRMGQVEWAEPGTWTKAYDFVTRDAALTTSYLETPPTRASEEDDEPDLLRTAVVAVPEAVEEPRFEYAATTRANGGFEEKAGEEKAGEPVGAGANDGPVRHKWVKMEGLRRSDPFPDAQWLS